MLKPFIILFLLAAVIVSADCQASHPTSTITLGLPSPALTVTPTPTLPPTSMPTVTPTSTPILTPIPMPTPIDPSQFIPLLRRISTPFDKFYGNEIEPIHIEINWFLNPNLPNLANNLAVTVPRADWKVANVTLWHIPNAGEGNASLQKDAFVIAHELATLVIGPTFQSGWDLKCSNDQITGDLKDMIATPLRNHVLYKYGFGLQDDFQSYLQDFLNKYSTCAMPTDPVALHDAAFDYVWFQLYWQYALGNRGNQSDIDNLYQRCVPTARQEGLKILGRVDKFGGLGNITSDSAKSLFEQIIGNDTPDLDCKVISVE